MTEGPQVLDDIEEIARLDSEDVLGAVERFAEQCRVAWDIGGSAESLPDADGVDSIAVLGMGGSGVSGDVVQSVVEPRLAVPLRTFKGYGPLPEWIGRNTLVFAVSYSGGTEETLAAFEEAHSRGARAVTISSGGALAEAARNYGVAHVGIPAGLQPRASLGYLTMPLLAVLARVGLVPDMKDDVEEAVEVVTELASRCNRKEPAGSNPAKQLATRIHGRIPIVYAGDGLGATAAYRFKCDLNEYGKTPAYWHFFPELNHNEIVGWNRLEEVTKERFMAVMLRTAHEHPRVSLRFEITRDLIEPNLAEIYELSASGTSPLAQLLSLIFVTQMAAIYVGLAYGVDPGPVEVIQSLKKQLAEQ